MKWENIEKKKMKDEKSESVSIEEIVEWRRYKWNEMKKKI